MWTLCSLSAAPVRGQGLPGGLAALAAQSRWVAGPAGPAGPAGQTYELLDCGDGKRLERFGDRLVTRSCVTAQGWPRNLRNAMWGAEPMLSYAGSSGQPGQWSGLHGFPPSELDNWTVRFGRKVFSLNPLAMGQVGVFPEQRPQWDWIETTLGAYVTRVHGRPVKVLNGFAYTGGSTLAAMVHERVQVTHLDASRAATAMAATNVRLSDTRGSVRWMVDDLMAFLQREARRGARYDGLIFDPPAFGRADGRTWRIDRDLPELLALVPRLLSAQPAFVLVTAHDERWPADVLKEQLRAVLPANARGAVEAGPMQIKPSDPCGRPLPLGGFARWTA